MGKTISLFRTFILPEGYSVQKIAEEFCALAGDCDLIPQKQSKDGAPWATGWIKINGHRLIVYLDNSFIDSADTPAELEIIR